MARAILHFDVVGVTRNVDVRHVVRPSCALAVSQCTCFPCLLRRTRCKPSRLASFPSVHVQMRRSHVRRRRMPRACVVVHHHTAEGVSSRKAGPDVDSHAATSGPPAPPSALDGPFYATISIEVRILPSRASKAAAVAVHASATTCTCDRSEGTPSDPKPCTWERKNSLFETTGFSCPFGRDEGSKGKA